MSTIRRKVNNVTLPLLLVITLGLVLAQHFALNNELIINGLSDVLVTTETDKKFNGLSTSTMSKSEDGSLLVQCNIKKSDYEWPFCNLTFLLYLDKEQNQQKAFNLSRFDTIHISAHYLTKTKAGLRFQLRNFNEKYSVTDDPESWKFISVEYWTIDPDVPTSFPMSSMQVPSWWKVLHKVPIELSAPEFDQIMLIEIATGNNIEKGEIVLKIDQIKFTGKYFTNEQVYAVLLMLWLAAAVTDIFLKLIRTKDSLSKEIRKSEKLLNKNRRLKVETRKLKAKASKDQLTGALSRHGADELFCQELGSYSVILLDIDHFKAVNDNFGHSVGDDVLKQFAKLVSANSRKTDFLIRWGGEEFLLLCLDTETTQAYRLAEHIRALIANQNWPKGLAITCSFGISESESDSIVQCIEKADKALYSAKEGGRNKTVVYSEQGAPSVMH